MTTDTRIKERRAKYEERREEYETFYRGIDDDQILEMVARNFSRCSSEMCFACLDNEVLVNELRRRIEVDCNE